jgi:hydroxyethylthiazole kinase
LLEKFKEYKPSVIRGNASEIIALSGLWKLTGENRSNVRGVDSTDSVISAKTAAVALARCTGGVAAVSGETDLITDGEIIAYSHGGSHFLGKITGAGCSLGGVTGVYLSSSTPFIAALTAAQIYNLAGERAHLKSTGPGGFQVRFLDELYNAAAEDVADNSFELEEVL